MISINNIIKYKEKEHKLLINVEFDTHIELTPRIIEVSTAFGLGISEHKKFSVFEDFNIGFNNDDLVYITGDSGGGKSVLMNHIMSYLTSEKIDFLNLDDIKPDPEEIIIESIGDNTNDAVYYLSRMGLNDAFIFLRRYKHLSDGQKYRYRLAKALSQKPSFIFIDEYCANLDRITAKVISYNFQKTCRAFNIGGFVSTTHNDLLDDFNANIIVNKKFMNDVVVEYRENKKKQISFINDVTFKKGTLEDYKKLNKFHYKNTHTNFPHSHIVTMMYGNDIVGVAVFAPTFFQTKGRTIHFGKTYSKASKENAKEINRDFIRGARYVISPKYRGCGLGQKLVIEPLKFMTDKKYLEVITVMGKYNPVFERAGMKKIEIEYELNSAQCKINEWLAKRGYDTLQIHNIVMMRKFFATLEKEDKKELQKLASKLLSHQKAGMAGHGADRNPRLHRKQEHMTSSSFEEVEDEILDLLPRLYTGNTLYYILDNPYYKEPNKQLTFEDM